MTPVISLLVTEKFVNKGSSLQLYQSLIDVV